VHTLLPSLEPLVQIFLGLHNVILVVQFDSCVSEYGLIRYRTDRVQSENVYTTR